MTTIATRPRRFTLADAIVLVAATAAGLALVREWVQMASPTPPIFHYDTGSMARGPLCGLAPLTRWVVLGWPLVAMWTLTLVVLRFRRPRPRARRLFAPPGVAACLVAAVVLMLEATYTASLSVPSFFKIPLPTTAAGRAADGRWRQMTYWTIHAAVENSVGFAVAAWWVTLALSRRWRPERSWIDRAGLVVGVLWIILVLLRLHLRMNYLDV
ncbi:MAG TPA: hypothetical protein VGH33_20400 [Isosphaeraceae bacterium]|jgi:hypothetical protein